MRYSRVCRHRPSRSALARHTAIRPDAIRLQPLMPRATSRRAKSGNRKGLPARGNALRFGLVSARDLYAKLGRDAARLDAEMTSDAFFNFVVTGYSLIDWVRHDPGVPDAAKKQAVIDALYSDRWLRTCGDLATAVKHFALTRRDPVTAAATSRQGFGHGRFGKGGFGHGEENITIKMNDETHLNALELVNGVVGTWEAFFARYPATP